MYGSPAESQIGQANGENRGLWPTWTHSSRYLAILLKGWPGMCKGYVTRKAVAKKNPSGLSIRPLGNNTSEFPFSFVPLPCGFISFPGKEIMPHPFLPLPQQFPSLCHSHVVVVVVGSWQSREGPLFYSSWEVKRPGGPPRRKCLVYWELRIMPGRGMLSP